MRTALPELSRWEELPVWAALLINESAPGLTREGVWLGWTWWGGEPGRERIVIRTTDGFNYTAVRGYPYIF